MTCTNIQASCSLEGNREPECQTYSSLPCYVATVLPSHDNQNQSVPSDSQSLTQAWEAQTPCDV